MPNWCRNKIEIEGTAEEIAEVFAFVGEYGINFNKILPYPEEYAKLDAEVDEDGINRSKGFNSGGYEWCIANWGTKWNAQSAINNENYIAFSTAWTPSFEITKLISLRFPSLTFTHKWEEEGMWFSGYAIYRAGVLVEMKEGNYDDYPINGEGTHTKYDEDGNMIYDGDGHWFDADGNPIDPPENGGK